MMIMDKDGNKKPSRPCKYCHVPVTGEYDPPGQYRSAKYPDECPYCHRSFKGRSHYENRDKKAQQQRKADHSLDAREV